MAETYVVGWNVGTVIFDLSLVTALLTIVSIARAMTVRRHGRRVADHPKG